MKKPSVGSVLPEIMTVHAVVRSQSIEKYWFFIKVFQTALKNTHFLIRVENGAKSPIDQVTIHWFWRDLIYQGIEADPTAILVLHQDIDNQLLSTILFKQMFPRFHRDLDVTGTVLNSNRIPLFGSNQDEILLTGFLNRKIHRCNVGRNFYAGIIGLNSCEPTYGLDVRSSLRCRWTSRTHKENPDKWNPVNNRFDIAIDIHFDSPAAANRV